MVILGLGFVQNSTFRSKLKNLGIVAASLLGLRVGRVQGLGFVRIYPTTLQPFRDPRSFNRKIVPAYAGGGSTAASKGAREMRTVHWDDAIKPIV
jgi:hypothetical protein